LDRELQVSLSMSQAYDAIIIGGGQAGPSLAARFAAAGKSVALVERHLLGGTCVNAGCTPTKSLIASARIAFDVRRSRDYGIEIPPGMIAVDLRAVQARKDRIVNASRSGLENWLRGMPNCTLYQGHARFESPHSVSVGDTLLTAEQIFVNVGGRPPVPSLPGI
jgi:pyruvate/2-oxoglutarate dehydrogenase complex dihydrolipoamide dehydrogenase (E3) component